MAADQGPPGDAKGKREPGGSDKDKCPALGATRRGENRNRFTQEGYDMKFKTSALIEAVETEIQRRIDAADREFAQAKANHAKARADWLASDRPKILADTSRKVLDKVRKGRPIYPEDVKVFDTNGYRQADRYVFSGREPKRDEVRGATPVLEKLEALRDFLRAVSDEEITSTGLREVGFRNIAEILRYAAAR